MQESDALEKFEVVRVLNHLRERHCIFLLAKDKSTNEENAVIKLEKTAFKVVSKKMSNFCALESQFISKCRHLNAYQMACLHYRAPKALVLVLVWFGSNVVHFTYMI